MSKHSITAPGFAGLALAALSMAVAGALVSPVASASGFQISENTVQAMGRAYAGREAAGNDASVVMNNPAAMVDFDTYAVQIDATAINVAPLNQVPGAVVSHRRRACGVPGVAGESITRTAPLFGS